MSQQAFTLKSYEFRRERESSWAELEILVDRIEKSGLKSLSAEELHQLPSLYRAALSSLSVARSISLDRNVVEYLESLASRAYVCVYSTRRGGLRTVVDFLVRGFPQLVYELRWQLWLAIFLMTLGAACGFALTAADPERFYSFVDPALAGGRGPTASREELNAVLFGDSGGSTAQLSQFASFLFQHNAKIGMMCFGLGFLAGVPVALLLFTNGLMLGAMIAVHWHKDLTIEFCTWVMGHGVTELLAVCLCGAAGLAVGQALVFPGVHKRLENLARMGRKAGAVVIGTVLLFFIAALIEGYFRQLVPSVELRALMAGVTAVLWFLYFYRGKPERVDFPKAGAIWVDEPEAPPRSMRAPRSRRAARSVAGGTGGAP